MEIHQLSEHDAKAYWRLRLEALDTEPFAFGKAAEEHQAIPVDEFAQRFRNSTAGNFTIGAFEASELVGNATFVRETGAKERHKGHVYGVYVSASRRGHGTGLSLMQALIEKAKQNSGLEQILLAVSAQQEQARRLYRKLGFEPWGMEPRALKIGADYIDEEHMTLRL